MSTEKERSVLDEIRSTIASLDALRSRDPARTAATKSAAVGTDQPTGDAFDPAAVAEAAVAMATRQLGTQSQFDATTTVKLAPPAVPSSTHSDESCSAEPSAVVVEPSADKIPPAKNPTDAVAQPSNPSNRDRRSGSSTSGSSTSGSSAVRVETPSVLNGMTPLGEDEDEFNAGEIPATRSLMRELNKDAKIMIVDDEPLNIMTFRQHLKMEGYENFVSTTDAVETLSLVKSELPDVLLLDIRMPRVSGLDILRVMGLDPVLQHIPVLILTAATDPMIRKSALDLGASDFLSKPIDPNELLPRVRNAIILKKHYDMVANEAARLELQVERRTRQLEATRQQLILSLARAAEHRDNDTGNHVIRVGRYTSIIADAMGYPRRRLQMLEQAAQLHDVGKIGIPDSILFKPGKLDWDQYELMKRHCAIGKQIIEPISEKSWEVLKTHTRKGENLLHVRSSPLLMLAARIAQTHHEKWDGSGYPLGLQGEDIPLEGRIVAVADVFDALSSARPYKKPFSREKCFEILEEGRGKHFDPRVLDAFFSRSKEIIDTQLILMDEEDRFVGEEFVEEDVDETSVRA
ncbi:MAG: response regulator [Planctomycetaceae bacterium]|nr:response regulator [Planctomycetaceae bacterium]